MQPVWKAQEMGYPLPDWEFDYHPDLLPAQTRVKWLPRMYRALVLRAEGAARGRTDRAPGGQVHEPRVRGVREPAQAPAVRG
ncbi:hypothetical protein [Meiothermus granaticius]|uniref:hypothetical protein n=1 Tax=Meiothermus granaticius TaxID=863370 RepID=UPI0011BFDC4E|nr:hypothetical protein [Meiothermus granaticius]MCL6527563.1 hypothetical protein [Thermaceae bacterium]